MTTGHKITLPKSKLKDGKVVPSMRGQSVSAKIRQRKSKRVKVVRRTS